MSGNPIISVSNITKSFGEVRALDEVELKVYGGIFGIIGPNGAGKTTLLKILLGLLSPDSGTAEVLGYDISQDSLRIRRVIGVLHERPSYPNRMTVQTYLNRVEGLYGKRGNTEKVLKLVKLSNACDRRIGALSAGMLQRLGIAQALVGDPKLIFLDEPTSNLDVDGRDDVARMILDIYNETGVSFVIASHILSDLERVCHGVAIIRHGKVIEAGGVQETIQRYTTRRFRVVTSNPKGLVGKLELMKDILECNISGANTITIRMESENLSGISSKIHEIGEKLGIRVYAIEHADTLEDAFRELVRDEE